MISNEMMEVLKAYPVWPIASDGRSEVVIVASTEGNSHHGSGVLNWSRVDLLGSLAGAWVERCAHLEHIAARVELFEGAPEGTTHTDLCNAGFFYTLSKGLYLRSCLQLVVRYEKVENLIPRPTQEEMKMLEDSKINDLTDVDDINVVDKWMPEIGVECECTFGTKKNWYKFVISGDWGFILIGDYWQRKPVCEFEGILFRPLKSEREKFVEQSKQCFDNVSHMINPMLNADLDKILNEQFDNGARFTG